MRHTCVVIVIATILTSCTQGQWRGNDLCGTYETDLHETFEDEDGIVCNVSLKSSETLDNDGMDLSATMRMDVHFGGVIEFQDLSLVYDIAMKGSWQVHDDTLEVLPLPDSFRSEFRSSSATRPTEEAMVRHMRRYVTENIERQIKQRLTNKSRVVMTIDSVNEDGVWGQSAECPFVMRKVGK